MTTSINILKEQIANETNVYKVKSLKEKLSWLVAEENGNYITTEHLKEYRTYIISIINGHSFINNNNTLVDAMNTLLARVNNNELVFRTSKGIKGIIASAAKEAAKGASYRELIRVYGNNVIYDKAINDRYTQFYLGK